MEAEGNHSQIQPEVDGIRSVSQLEVVEHTRRDVPLQHVEGTH
jgi:hypothetical protein